MRSSVTLGILTSNFAHCCCTGTCAPNMSSGILGILLRLISTDYWRVTGHDISAPLRALQTPQWVRWRLKSPASQLFAHVCSGADQTKHQTSASLAIVRGIYRSPVDSPHEGPVTRKYFHFMTSSLDKMVAHSIYVLCDATSGMTWLWFIHMPAGWHALLQMHQNK